jgi:hypothetical protein
MPEHVIDPFARLEALGLDSYKFTKRSQGMSYSYSSALKFLRTG